MNSRADDPGDSYFRVPLENQTQKEFQLRGSWIPFTPKKPLQGTSSLIVDERVMHQDLNGVPPGGGFEERGFCKSGAVCDLNYAVQGMDQNVVYNSGSFIQRGSSQAGCTEFELDDLLDPVQTPFSFTSLLSGGDHLFQVRQYGTRACNKPLYNLNSPIRREVVGSVFESSFQSVPSTPSLCRTGEKNGFLEKIITTTGHEITDPKSDKMMKSIVDSSVVNSTEVTKENDGRRQDVLEFDLNMTPQQKPSKRKKKFMPKVVVEGKPKRKPRKPATQESMKSKETGSSKRKKAQMKNLKESTTKKQANVGHMSNKIPEVTLKSCRKALNFSLEESGDASQGDSVAEFVQSGSKSFSDIRDATGGTSGSFPDSATQIEQSNGLVASNQPLEASMGNPPEKLPRVLQENYTQLLARDQQPELLIGNQQPQFPVATHNTQFPMGSQQAWLQMKNQLIGFPFDNQKPPMTIRNQQPCLAMGNQQPMYLIGTPQPALVSENQQLGGLQGNKQPIFLNQQTCLPAGNRQYGSPAYMNQLVMSTGGQQDGLLIQDQQPGLLLRNQQPGSSMRGQQCCEPLMNQQPGTLKGFTHLNRMVAACMSSPGLRRHFQSQIPAKNLHAESVTRSLNGTAGTCQRSSTTGTLQQDIHLGNEYIPSHERSNGDYFDVCKKELSPVMAKLEEARGSKRQYHRAMGQVHNHDLNLAGRWPSLQRIAQSQDVEIQNSTTCGEYSDAKKKIKIQKIVHANLHGMPPEVIEVEDDPTDGARKDKNIASIIKTGPKAISCLVQKSADNEKFIVPKTPAKKGHAGRKKSIHPPSHASDIQLWQPTPPKTPSSRSKAKEKGRKSIPDTGKLKGPSRELKCEDSIGEIIYRMQNLTLGEKSRAQEQNALVLYRADGAVVPYESKKRKPRPKVDLDDETARIWNLLMGNREKGGDEEMDKKTEKWWEEERRVFRGRADSFIARMHLVQGDRRFSPWKGSVVDSVIGVFLTQNVTDHLSSSAFMSLAARFPPKLGSNREDETSIRSVVIEDPEGCILNLNVIPSLQEKIQNPSDKQVSEDDSGSKEQQRDCSNSGIERFDFLENSSQNLEEEVLSSQDSFDPAIFQSCGRVGSSSCSKSDAEFSTPSCETKTVSGSSQSVQTGSPNLSVEICLQENERPVLYERSSEVQIQETTNVVQKKPDLDKTMNCKDHLSFGQPSNDTNWQKKGPTNPFSSYEQSTIRQPHVLDIEDFGMQGEGLGYSWLSISPRVDRGKNRNVPRRFFRQGGSVPREYSGQITPSTPHELPVMGFSASASTHEVHQGDAQHQPHEMNKASHLQKTFMELLNSSEECLTRQSSTTQNITDGCPPRDRTPKDVVESNSINKEQTTVEYNETNATIVREMKGTLADGKKPTSQWDRLRKDVDGNEGRKERSKDSVDSIDYEAIRRASISEISEAIKERGMNNMLAVRIKDFLERIVKDHGGIDLEWLRDVPPDKAKDYLLSIRGLGLKSVECVRLLTLHNLAFPVDTNVGRIAVRLGWVPLQPLPESLQLHLLELYPVLESIQKFLWPRLCKLDQRTLYELHYQLITFGKVFCTKSRPNCNACPMRGECRHFASAYASARLALPAPDERSLTSSNLPAPPESFTPKAIPMMELPPPLEKSLTKGAPSNRGNCEPIIEEPSSPEQECTEITESDTEDAYYNEDPDEIPTIKLNIEQFGMTLREHMERNMELQDGDMSKALVALNPTNTSIPTPKLKNISRLRTEHQVYELPDSHPLLNGMDKREPDDPSPYLLAIWTPGETANSAQPPEQKCKGKASGKMCFDETCLECNSVREANSQTVRGTLLIPCRTAMRGSFPLNGTYFQVNELFADHDSSLKPIDVPRDWIWKLPRRTVYFGTSVTSIFRGLSTEQIQYCFWKGFVCVRGFEQKTRAPRPLMARLHFPASKLKNNKT
ncbi:PREDICTED: transcriptional activator DEMETER-like isoform X2 [Camelina sativa]|uniref:Transcriptional activator DEMETER-like isoform X1 n=2 Tax=Camelina sativa TaxID=90675 RepID=A0ABM0V815_CAMSA|nr:PREDICTED: transcriptional activator DEMETER-like isoform X1 [Camelina sativa]XP_010452356.1 PREDICTED: transcriptional activator DEMETER-like isoform X1 [Camelina sativa]XP_010452357.1 PREDICTED: transcriptional activator DEMETER-like isoform X1 [Camelina sativa]XP_010452359.1 PREDICTED: transcriptional activator DEMETER-like isoform X4 [Camelina sativa]XP_019090479.1 PREDICTED: transcriptional activator DEMETER-like isoform X2 [Camelina sativa]